MTAPNRPQPADHAPGDIRPPAGVEWLAGDPTPSHRAVAIAVARFNGEITSQLLDSALTELDALGVTRAQIAVATVPGAFELPIVAQALARTGRYACVVALGCVIRGETAHFDYVAGEAASGLQTASLQTGVPIAFGVLTVDTVEQAQARTASSRDAVRTALEMADLIDQIRATPTVSPHTDRDNETYGSRG